MNKQFNSIRYKDDFPITTIEEIRIGKILKLIGKNKAVLDLGCGDGFIMERIRGNNNVVSGVEIAENAVLKARAKGFKVYDFLLERDWSTEIGEKFDVVFAGEIIEHIFDTDNFLQNVRGVMKDDGFLVITTPNVASLGRRLFLLFGKNPLIETTARKDDAGHIRYFTFDSLKKLLMENDFEICEVGTGVINFSNDGKLFSDKIADIFPRFGNNIIVKARKSQ